MKDAKLYQEQLRQIDGGGDHNRDSLYEEDVEGVTFYAVGTPANVHDISQ